MIKILNILENYGVCSCTCHFFFVSLCTFCAHDMKLSIITINRNNAAGLRKTMESVFNQTCKEFEYVIVDGASTDGSLEVIQEMSASLDNGMSRDKSLNDGMSFKWISEPDTGIYNAMNKGARKAQGEYVLMLNSGDYFVDEHVVERVLPELDGTDIIQGNVILERNGVKTINRGYGKSDISFIEVMKGFFLHQASFCRRDLFERYGYFDETYRINGDTVFYAKCLGFGNASFKYIDLNIAFFDTTGISADPNNKYTKLRAEEDKRYQQMFSPRMYALVNEEKKIKLYDKLHAHKWSWNLTMTIAHLMDVFSRKK